MLPNHQLIKKINWIGSNSSQTAKIQNIKKYIVVLILFVTVMFVACNNEVYDTAGLLENEVNISSTVVVDSSLGFVVKVHDNTLCFDSAKDVLSALSILNKMPKEERRSWEKSVGFTSALTQIEGIKKEIEQMETQDEFDQMIMENQELVLEDTTECYNFKPRVYGNYPAITGKNGLFVSEEIWCKVFDGKLYSTNTFDREGYLLLCKLYENKDIAETNIKSITVDFNWEDCNLKSYHDDIDVKDTRIELEIYNYAVNNPTKKAVFTLELVNNYTTRQLSQTSGYTVYYLDVYYDGACSDCNPYGYSITYAGNTYTFDYVGYKHYRIQLPYSSYLNDYPFSNPNWDDQNVWPKQIITAYWYTYFGNVQLVADMQAYDRGILPNSFDEWDGTIVWFDQVTAEIEIGEDVYYRSSAINTTPNALVGNAPRDEDGKAEAAEIVYEVGLSLYGDEPPVKFKGCVSGILGARFCPDDYEFSFNF